jgi:hypothetical protein
MGAMVHAPRAPDEGAAAVTPVGFAITLKGWRSQLRWAMTQREEDPARVWLEVISIDERSKRAVAAATAPEQLAELAKFRQRLEESIASLTEELGDDNVAPLYSWLDLVRQRRRMFARIEEAREAVRQARAIRLPDGSKAPVTDAQAASQLVRAQGELEQWVAASPPAPPAEVRAIWEAEGGDALRETRSNEPMVVGRRGDRARRVLERTKGRVPGKHPWHGSRGERIAIPALLAFAVASAALAVPLDSAALAANAAIDVVVVVALVAFSVVVRRVERVEVGAALDWAWHAILYEERARLAELEAGWLRALVDAQRALNLFDAGAAAGGQLRAFEQDRPDLAEMVHEVARDTEEGG